MIYSFFAFVAGFYTVCEERKIYVSGCYGNIIHPLGMRVSVWPIVNMFSSRRIEA